MVKKDRTPRLGEVGPLLTDGTESILVPQRVGSCQEALFTTRSGVYLQTARFARESPRLQTSLLTEPDGIGGVDPKLGCAGTPGRIICGPGADSFSGHGRAAR